MSRRGLDPSWSMGQKDRTSPWRKMHDGEVTAKGMCMQSIKSERCLGARQK